MTRDEIMNALNESRDKLLNAIEGLSDEELSEPGVIENWSVKDILYHLCMWEAELVKLLWQATQDQPPTTVHFSKIPVDEINAAWFAQGRARTVAQIMDDLHAVRKQTLRRAGAFKDQELNDTAHYPWQKGHPLWEWIAEDSFKHEQEHTAQIREWREKRGK